MTSGAFTPTAPDGREPHRLLISLLIVFAGLFVYAPVFHGDWLWDDDSEITEHAALRTLPGLIDIWAARGSPDYLPVKSTVQWLYYRFVEDNPTAWHLLNITLHLCAAFLIWRLFARLRIPHPWIGALIWAVHPFAVCSVGWISELKNTLSLPLYLLACLRFMDFCETRRGKDLLVAWIFFAASLLSKSSGVMLPFVLLLYIWWKQSGEAGGASRQPFCSGGRGLAGSVRAALVTAPFFLASLASGLSTIHFQQSRAIGPENLPLGGVFQRVVLSGESAWFYLYKSFFPFGLLPNYPRWNIEMPSLLPMLAWPALLALLITCSIRRRTWGRHALLGFGFFFLNLVPVLGFFRMSYMRITWVSDHLAYLSLVGIVGMVAAGCSWLFGDIEPRLRPFFLSIGTALLMVYAISAHQYAAVFTSEETMWKYTLRSNPGAWQAHSRLARVLGLRGQHGVAAFHVTESVRLRPDLPETHHNYAAVLMARGDIDQGIAEYRKAIGMAPYADMFKMNMANACVRVGRYAEAETIFHELMEKHPDHPLLLNNYGGVLFHEGRLTESARYFRKALDVHANMPNARANLELVLNIISRGGAPAPPGSGPEKISLLDSEVPLQISQPHPGRNKDVPLRP